jgi:hypothetical protein
VLDEVQKVPGWSEVVKWLWDADTHAGLPLKVVLLGSAPLLMRRGLAESLAGRFEVIPVPPLVLRRDAGGLRLELLVGPQGIALEDFLTRPAAYWLQ